MESAPPVSGKQSATALSAKHSYEPPDVTWPEPELADGADPVLRPPELELELEPEPP